MASGSPAPMVTAATADTTSDAHVVPPGRSGPPPVVPVRGLVHRHDGAADVLGVQVRAPDVVEVALPHRPHPEPGQPGPAAVEVVALHHHHVAAGARLGARAAGRPSCPPAPAPRSRGTGGRSGTARSPGRTRPRRDRGSRARCPGRPAPPRAPAPARERPGPPAATAVPSPQARPRPQAFMAANPATCHQGIGRHERFGPGCAGRRVSRAASRDGSVELGPAALLAAAEAGHAAVAVLGERPGPPPARVLGAGERRAGAAGGIAGGPTTSRSASRRRAPSRPCSMRSLKRRVLSPSLGPQRRAEGDGGPARLGPLHALAEDGAGALDEHRDHRCARPAGQVGRAALERLAPPVGRPAALGEDAPGSSRPRSAPGPGRPICRPATLRATGNALRTRADAALVTWVVKK